MEGGSIHSSSVAREAVEATVIQNAQRGMWTSARVSYESSGACRRVHESIHVSPNTSYVIRRMILLVTTTEARERVAIRWKQDLGFAASLPRTEREGSEAERGEIGAGTF